ncbi:HlyD family efflux transporter periplasmic adaptor subunit [Acetobacter fallax]|uniref:HlyD family efflux transporter periplasmic adaptor subunit n=1 Tax=Acetobacter fallax TaxID=1737473 RepID=A0ABX0KBS3_9PROT|nr:HlyD family efflux transporter periplasmic adaptor subunit [Acetobacter fallax]NHO37203.1 HlyD family efflux transporter periplasmic adaptor subunit [Acetobacter fallax]
MFERARRFLQFTTTGIILIIAAITGFVLWDYYTSAPWTRNGQVRVQAANIAPRVSGQIIALHVYDNQIVHAGDILYDIDPFDFKVAVAVATAVADQRRADMVLKAAQHERRDRLTEASASREEKQVYEATAEVSRAEYAQALAQLSQAKINLDRTHVRSTVTGPVNNLTMRVGDFATSGKSNITVIDHASYWVDGYFEETKIGSINLGDRVRVDLMGFREPLEGHVVSITRGIATSNASSGVQGLPVVDPVYTWVRLAQRIPVRVEIDRIPESVTIAAGMTATVTVVGSKGHRAHDTLHDAFDRLHDTVFSVGAGTRR